MVNKGKLYIISAPSGTGKTSLVKALVNDLSNIKSSISHTSRACRTGEVPGIDYHFISEEKFKEMRKGGIFLEYAKVYNYYYGTSSEWVKETLAKGTDVILEIDWQGARQIRIQFIDAISIYIIPPNEDALINRLHLRHQDNALVIETRMKQAKDEISHYTEYDYLLCNDQFEVALNDLKAIVHSNRLKLASQRYQLMGIITQLIS